MKFKVLNNSRLLLAGLVLSFVSASLLSSASPIVPPSLEEKYVAVNDTTDLPFPLEDQGVNPTENGASGVNLLDPDNINTRVEYDVETGGYVLVQTIGDSLYFRTPIEMTLDEYLDYNFKKTQSEFWNKQQEEADAENKAYAPSFAIAGEGFRKIFGSDEIEIRPQGSAELSFGVNVSTTENPRIAERQRTIVTPDFNQKIQLNVVGQIGTKLQLGTNYNTEATFDFENQMKLDYTGEEDEIIQKIEAGNVSLPLTGSLIQGSQSLFGLKLETKWGKLRNTTVLSQQRGERKEITVEGGAQTQTFDIKADAYEANRHYFLSQYFRDSYDDAMQTLPVVNSGVNITRIEVWAVNTQSSTQDVRNILAFTDLGESEEHQSFGYTDPASIWSGGTMGDLPDNDQNNIFQTMLADPQVLGYSGAVQAIQGLGQNYQQGVHYERVGNARKLSDSEFTFNSRLGFISLRQSLNNAEVLSVAYEYTLAGETYQVGTLSQDGITAPNALILKMLKSSITQVVDQEGAPAPMWDLMMKNVYSIGAFGVNNEDFRLNVWYNDPATGIDQNYVPRDPLNGKLLIRVLDMDKINVTGEAFPDGVFDFVDNASTQGGLINSQNGRIYMPVIEPFGEHLASYITDSASVYNINDQQRDALIDQIAFTELYDSTKTAAQQIPAKNRFSIRGSFKSSSSSEISLNSINIPQGSVNVTAGGIKLVEGQDYTVDYNLGRVRILDDGLLSSGTPINVSLESNSLFNIQTKTLLGSRFDYALNDDISFGATILNLRERPLTQKINVGDEPVNNTILGADMKYRGESRFITSLVDKLPFYETKAKSTIDFSAEAAYLIPGFSKAIGENGNAYIDDFEGSQSTIDLRALNQWFLASTPRHQPDNFPEALLENQLKINYNRAKLAWYQIDPIFYRESSNINGVGEEALSDFRMVEIVEADVFPERQLAPGTPLNILTLDLTYFPEERGPYNYDVPSNSDQLPPESDGLNGDGTLANPGSRWAGIQRSLTVNDFEASNIEFIQFWVMDPFWNNENAQGGDLYFNLGNVSEDILSDSGLSFENGLPSENVDSPVDSTIWGLIPDPSNFNVVNAFDNSADDHDAQDLGIDGLTDEGEREFFENEYGYLTELQNSPLSNEAFNAIMDDVSADNYQYPRRDISGEGLNTIERYKNFNGYQGNALNQNEAATTIPNTEDINRDNTLNTIESYYQYKVSLRPEDLDVSDIGSNFLSDVLETTKETQFIDGDSIKWYQFKIPVRDYEKSFNGITDFRSIRFMRMFMKGFDEELTLRFARLELVRGEWRTYFDNLREGGEIAQNDNGETQFTVGAVNVEENSSREPIPYVEPPGIQREIDAGSANLRNLNEQSLSLEVCNLEDGDSRAAYRNVNFDMRQYKRLKMFVHAESADINNELETGDLTCFIRLGSDFNENYYEYEIPLKPTDLDASVDTEIWPDENEFDIELSVLQSLKRKRDVAPGVLITEEYEEPSPPGNTRIKIKGNPNLANVVTVMVGVRNPSRNNNMFAASDDGQSECAEVWVNELRLTDFNNQGGGAAIATLSTSLADFGNLSLASSISNPGFGGLEQTLQERQRETRKSFDAQSTLQLGKLFGEKLGVQLPVYVGYSINTVDPQFDPLAPDVLLTDRYNDLRSEDITNGTDRVSEYQDRVQTSTVRRTVNFSNIRISPQPGGGGESKKDKDFLESRQNPGKNSKDGGKSGGKKQTPFYSVKNFSLSYNYSDIDFSDINTEEDLTITERAGLNYSFSYKPIEVKPFAKIGFIKDTEALKFIKDFNFNLGPKQVGFTTSSDRTYRQTKIRDNSVALGIVPEGSNLIEIEAQVLKNWNWNRNYTFKYDFTKNLKFDFQAGNQSLIREPQGTRADLASEDYKEALRELNILDNDSVGAGFLPGVTSDYNHNLNLSYKVPLDKFPLVNFISADARYAGTYRWTRAPLAQLDLGNTIQNSRNITLNGQANLTKLYNKSKYLKDLNRGKVPKKKEKEKEEEDDKKKEDDKEVDGFGEDLEDDKKKKKKGPKFTPVHRAVQLGMMLKSVSGNYSKNQGILLPGYNQNSYLFGMSQGFNGPGLDFITGQQNASMFAKNNEGLLEEISDNGWLGNNPLLNIQQNSTFSESYSFRANIEPIKDFKIELTMNRQYSENASAFYVFTETTDDNGVIPDLDLQNFDQFTQPGDFVAQSSNVTGNYTASIISWPTAFIQDREESDNGNELWDAFLNEYRLTISERVANFYNDADGTNIYDNDTLTQSSQPGFVGYFDGYGPLSQRVAIPAFVAAYTGQSVDKVSIDPFRQRVAPNWSVRYNGLTKIKSMKKIFKQFRVNHTYKSNYTTSFVTNVGYQGPVANNPSTFNTVEELDQAPFQNFIDQRQISTVSIVEQLSPLIGFDMTLNKKNKKKKPIDPQIKIEIRRDRTVTLGLANFQITETKSKAFVIGVGGKIPEVPLGWLRSKKSRLPGRYLENSPITLRADLTIRDNSTIIRRIEELSNQVTAGQRLFSLKTSADLQISDKLQLRFFYDHQITKPKISTSFPTSNVNSGISLRFQLSQ